MLLAAASLEMEHSRHGLLTGMEGGGAGEGGGGSGWGGARRFMDEAGTGEAVGVWIV